MTGIEISLEALSERGARLPKVDLAPPRSVIGKNTIDAIRSGVVYGYAGAIDAILRRLYDELGERAEVIATGGLAAGRALHRGDRGGRRPAHADRPAPAARAQRLASQWRPMTRATRSRCTDRWMLGPLRGAQPRDARAAGGDRQLVRAPAGQALRRGAWPSRRWSPPTRSTTATRRRARRCCASTRASATGGPVSIQLFGEDPDDDALGRRPRGRRGGRRDRHQHGLPGAEGAKTGAGAALLGDPDAPWRSRGRVEGAARRRARGARAGDGEAALGLRAGESSGFELAHRLVAEAGVAAIAFHPRPAAVQHKGAPTTSWSPSWCATLPAPVILSGGLERRRERARGVRRDRRRRRDARARRARQPVAVRRAARPASERSRRARRCCASSTGRSTGRRAPRRGSARRATCASSTPGTWRAWGSTRRAARELQEALQEAATLADAGPLLATVERRSRRPSLSAREEPGAAPLYCCAR